MKPLFSAVFALASAATLGACSGDRDTSSFRHFSLMEGNRVAVHARGAPDATITRDGSFAVDGKPVTLTPEQQVLLKSYYDTVAVLRDDAMATGRAGVATASQALGSVASALAKGNADTIDAEVEKKAAVVEANAAKLCVDLATLRAQQDVAANRIPAFLPYAQITVKEVADCAAG